MTTMDAGIAEVARSIWRTVLDLPLGTAEPGDVPAEPTVTCFVQVDGAWDGAVVLRCSQRLAGRIAAAMFASPGEPAVEEVSDAMGEITNILAGNIKALLPQPCRITLPVVALGSDYQLQMLRTQALAEVAFSCQGETFVVTVLQPSDLEP